MNSLVSPFRRDRGTIPGVAQGSRTTDRLVPAEETVARIRPRLAEFGITRLACTTGLDCIGIPVWMAIRPNSRTLSMSQGKGLSDAAAQASAVMEAVEFATAERLDLPARLATRAELEAGGARADPLDALLRKAVEPLAPSEPTRWIQGVDLIRQCSVHVPLDAVTLHDGYTTSRYWQSTDGLASGNALWEATCHGICERIERDAMTLASLRPASWLQHRCFDPRCFGDPEIDRLLDMIATAGLQIRLFDYTSDIGVPVCFACLSPPPTGHEGRWRHFDLASGCGCHPSPVRAAIRAITEAAQTRLTTISGARDDFDPARYQAEVGKDLLPFVSMVANPTTSLPQGEPSATADLDTLLAALQRAGVGSAISVVLADGSDGYAVAKVVIPELENPPGDHRFRFGKRAMRVMMGVR